MECNHLFEGRADGVHCKLCGLHLSTEEYRRYIFKAPAVELSERTAPKRGRKKVEK